MCESYEGKDKIVER